MGTADRRIVASTHCPQREREGSPLSPALSSFVPQREKISRPAAALLAGFNGHGAAGSQPQEREEADAVGVRPFLRTNRQKALRSMSAARAALEMLPR